MDVRGVAEDGNEVYIEVENTLAGTNPHRPRLYTGMRDSMHENPGLYGENLPQMYMTFVCRHDPFGMGKGRYVIRRMIGDTGRVFEDGITIIYLYIYGDQETALLGDLMHDFTCADYKEMRVPAYARVTRQLKETEDGGSKVSEIFENYINEHKNEWLKEGEKRGEVRGEARGEARGADMAMQLIQRLMAEGRSEDVIRVSSDAEYRNRLFAELNITNAAGT